MAEPNGGGPPPGSLGDSPFAQQIPVDQLRDRIADQIGGDANIVRNDPAFQPPHDPLQGPVRERTGLVYRDIPLISIVEGVGNQTQPGWNPKLMRGVLRSHTVGIFDGSGQLVDSVIADDRVQATLNSRLSGLFGREVRFKPANDSSAAKECLQAWADHWPQFADGSALPEMTIYQILMGITPGQLLWDTDKPIWRPYLKPFHPRFVYYHWNLRKFIALTLDGQSVIFPGDGKWVLHAPKGEYRGWMWGAIRAVAEPWLLRHYALRDMARFSERHGMPIIKAKAPAAGDEVQRDRFEQQMANLGTETCVLLNQGVDGINNYDLELLEATDQAWQIFPGLIDRCDMSIVLALLFQNLTTEVKGGSFAATEAHMDIRQNGIEGDNQGWKLTIRNQIARPFAMLNFGDADLAPVTDWDVTPKADYKDNASLFYSFGQSVQILRQGGVKFPKPDELRQFARDMFGLTLPRSLEITEPDSGSGSPDAVTDKKETGDAEVSRPTTEP